MYPRTQYEMTQQDLDRILDACKPVPLIMLQFGMPRSPQERANDAWAELGKRMNFDPMTVMPTGQGDRFFTAIPCETPDQKSVRLQREAEEKRLAEVKELRGKLETINARLAELLKNSFPHE